jgi:flagellar protein FlaF
MHTATRAYASIAKETARPRELEATLLLKAAAKLQAVHDAWEDGRSLDEALLYNRRLWVVFIDSILQDDHPLPVPVRQNLANLGVFVMTETFALMTDPQPAHLLPLIKINRELATGLQGRG